MKEKEKKEAADETRDKLQTRGTVIDRETKRKRQRERESQGNESVRNERLKSLAGIRDA